MLKVLFFARIREELGCDSLSVEWSPSLARLDDLQDQLCVAHGDQWRSVLGQDNMIRAVNQAVVTGDHALHDGDEVAFFPPVTGG